MGWAENMANVIRTVLFSDSELKTLMAIPQEDFEDLIAFRDRYFVRGNVTDNLVLGEDVRILYHDDEPSETDSNNVMKHRLYLDVYVKKEAAYNASNNRMLHRGDLIGKRLNQLLSGKKLCNIRFSGRGVYSQTSKAAGYDRTVVVFMYKRIYP